MLMYLRQVILKHLEKNYFYNQRESHWRKEQDPDPQSNGVQIRQIRIHIETWRIRYTGFRPQFHLFIYAKLKLFIISKQSLAQNKSLHIYV